MSNKQPDVERWYFKTFRIYDSPKKDKPEEAITKATFDSFVGELVVDLHNKAIDKAADTIERLQAENERLSYALSKLEDWANAYPLKVFPEPDFVKVRELLAAGGIRLDAVSGSNMRHVITRVKEIIEQALKESGNEQ